ncbi:hypothetical protein ACQY0O_000745 [Thecaphora frezii]
MAAVSPQKVPPSIRPGQYSRAGPTQPFAAAEAHSPSKSAFRIQSDARGGPQDARGRPHAPRGAADKENDSRFASGAAGPSNEHLRGSAVVKGNPIIDPKYRLRGNSPEDAARAASSSKLKLRSASSQSPTKSKARSRSRSRLFNRDRAPSPEAVADAPKSHEEIESDFVQLLDEMQVQPELRRKLLSLDPTIKSSMLKGQASLSLSGLGLDDSTGGSPSKSRQPIPVQMRKTKSSANLKESVSDAAGGDGDALERPNKSNIFSNRSSRCASGSSVSSGSDSSSRNNPNIKRGSADVLQGLRGGLKSPNLGQGVSLLALQGAAATAGGRQRAMSFGKELSLGKDTPETFATVLKAADARRLDVAKVKRMRAVLASESPAWISQFVGPECGGYEAMLVRLDELLNMEWREEQHDDMLLHELLRCFVALSTTEVGRGALQQRAPTPFKELVDLLFSEKKPGELPTRKLMVDLIALVMDLQLPATVHSASSSLNFLLQLMQNPADPAKEQVVDFIKQTHTPRPFKVYLTELASICRDYFWIFCHAQNRFWRFEDLDVETIKCPKVPGGMTGGVEFEAMGYLTTHFRLINSVAEALAQPVGHGSVVAQPDMTAYDFHGHLFASGLERILAHLRRSSQHYYSPMHLELARYISLATTARFELPLHITDWLMPPKNPQPQPTFQLGSLGTSYAFSDQLMHSLLPPTLPPSEELAGGMKAVASGRASDPAVARTDRASPSKDAAPPLSPSKHFASGRWLANGGQPTPAAFVAPPTAIPSPLQAAPPSATAPVAKPPTPTSPTKSGSPTLQTELAPPRPLGKVAGDSVVGSAIKKWESLAGASSANQSRAGLGLGWAGDK